MMDRQQAFERITMVRNQFDPIIMALPDVVGVGTTIRDNMPGIIVFLRSENESTIERLAKLDTVDVVIYYEITGGFVAS